VRVRVAYVERSSGPHVVDEKRRDDDGDDGTAGVLVPAS
jgi:hypothetical protein